MKPAILIALTRGADKIAHALLDRADLEIVNLYDAVIPYLKDRGLPFRRFLDFFPHHRQAGFEADAAARAETVIRSLDDLRNAYPQFDDSQWQRVARETTSLVRSQFFTQIVLAETIQRCAAAMDLRLIVVQQDLSGDMRTLIRAGHRLGIPALHTLHGVPYGAVAAINGFVEPTADALAVFSDYIRDQFIALGVPADRLFVTGNFEWDLYARPPAPGHRETMCRHVGLDPACPVVLYAMTYTHAHSDISAAYPDYVDQTTDAILRAFVELSRRHPNLQFVVRPHPNDAKAPDRLRSKAAELGIERVWFDNSLAAPACLGYADVVLCTQSNLGIEAILWGIPVVNVVIEEFGQPVFDEGIGRLFHDDDAVLQVHRVGDIAGAVESALTDPAVRAALLERRAISIKRFNQSLDGQSTVRLCGIILEMMRTPERWAPSVDRYPAFEPFLAARVPAESRNVLVAGAAAQWTARAVPRLDGRQVLTAPLDALPDGPFDAVVIADPIDANAHWESSLSRLAGRLAQDGSIVTVVLNGCSPETKEAVAHALWCPERPGAEAPTQWGAPSPRGLEIMLSRAGLELVDLLPWARNVAVDAPRDPLDADAWIVHARPRPQTQSALTISNEGRYRQAVGLNAEGERLFASGDIVEAASRFAAAIRAYDRDPLFHNNLGVALHALDRPEEAWNKFIDALHFDPGYTSARENLFQVASSLDRSEEAKRILTLFGAD